MEEHENPIFGVIGNYYKSKEENTTTGRITSHGLREIDHIFSTAPLTRINLSEEKAAEFTSISDHRPLRYSITGYTTSATSIIPNKAFAHKLLRKLMRIQPKDITVGTISEQYHAL